MSKQVNLIIDQATSFSRQLTARANNGAVIDLTNYELRSQIKQMFVSFTAYEFDITVDDAVNGLFTISLEPEASALIPARRHVYDIVITDQSGFKTRIYEGVINVTPAVTEANPFVTLEGVRISDPNLVHAHDNQDVLDLITDASNLNTTWEKVDTDDFSAANGGRYMVDTTAGIINIRVPDEPEEDFRFSFEVMDMQDNFAINKVVIKNESETVIYESSVNGDNFSIIWTDATDGYKIRQ